MKVEALKTEQVVARRYRNRRVGEFLKELRLTEGRGTGIPTIRKAMRENGSPEPSFDSDEERSYFTAAFPIHPLALPDSDARSGSSRSDRATGRVIGKVPGKDPAARTPIRRGET